MTYSDALISIRPRFVEQIMAGDKTVEIRRRGVSLRPGTRLWIYSTIPVGKVTVLAKIRCVEEGLPDMVWSKWGPSTCLESEEYWRYLRGAKRVTAIMIEVLTVLDPGPGLSCLRAELGSFHPPQFFMKVQQGSDLLKALRSNLPSEGNGVNR